MALNGLPRWLYLFARIFTPVHKFYEMKIILKIFVNLHRRNIFYINEIRKYIAGRTYVFVVDVTIFVTDFYQAQMTITEHKL